MNAADERRRLRAPEPRRLLAHLANDGGQRPAGSEVPPGGDGGVLVAAVRHGRERVKVLVARGRAVADARLRRVGAVARVRQRLGEEGQDRESSALAVGGDVSNERASLRSNLRGPGGEEHPDRPRARASNRGEVLVVVTRQTRASPRRRRRRRRRRRGESYRRGTRESRRFPLELASRILRAIAVVGAEEHLRAKAGEGDAPVAHPTPKP
mmetsp:Transcript_11922/g.50105  ORF Transcript_11922/g.50105 Transcript_11922/m.50105 type:complete len:211 (-) Transcript_11922:761-1393(-)